ncbi:MAG TPA: CpaF family protein [Verrucomicrobiae bacterium]
MGIDKELKRDIRVETGMRFVKGMPSSLEAKEAARLVLDSKLKQKRLQLDAGARESLVTAICDDLLGFGPLEPLLDDNTITEIMVNGPDRIFIERSGRKTLSEIQFDDESHLRTIMEKMLVMAGRRLDESSPYVDFSLKDGSRINAIISPLAVDGSTVTIRKFLDTLNSLDELVRLKTINEPMSRFLRAAIKAKLNIMFSGATGAGKTATLNVLSHEIAPDERIITIEDALELKLNQKHVVRLLTRANNIEGKGAVSVRQLFSNTLRMRPTRIILGEIRGEEALDYLQAINSGHDGTLAVLHASTPADVVGRLETMSMYAGLELPSSEIRRQIASGLNLIIQHEQLADGSRKITYLTEIGGIKEDGEIMLNDLFRFEITGRADNGEVTGEFKLVNRPINVSRFKKRGVRLDDIF